MKTNPVVGQKLFRLNIGKNARNRLKVLEPVTVVKVARKYFTVKTNCGFEIEHLLDDWREKSEYSPDYMLYESEEDWINEKRSAEICKIICKAFEYGLNRNKLSVGTLENVLHQITPL